MCDRNQRLSSWVKSGICGLALVVSQPLQADAQTILETIENTVNQIRTSVNTAITQAQAARAAAEEIRTQVRSGVSQMTPEIQAFIANAVSEGRTILEEESEGLDAFAPGGQCTAACATFRANLLDTLTSSVDLTNGILAATEAPANADFSRLAGFVESAPPRLLYPISRMLQNVLTSELADSFRGIVSETSFVLTAVRQEGCQAVVSDAERVQRWSSSAMKVSVVATVLGKLFNALGSTEIEASAGAMGFAGGTIKSNGKKKIGEVLTGLGTIVDKVSTFGTNKTRFCLIFAFQEETRATLASLGTTLSGLNLDLGNLDVPVSSRASQASLDAVHATLRTVAQDVAALGGGTGGLGSLTTRILIEQHLARKETPLSVLYLPEASGGLLEGVRDVVADAIANHPAAGQPIDGAWQFVAFGDAAKAQLDYRVAYAWYAHAYHHVVKAAAKRDQ